MILYETRVKFYTLSWEATPTDEVCEAATLVIKQMLDAAIDQAVRNVQTLHGLELSTSVVDD